MYRRILSGMLVVLMVFQLCAEKTYATETIGAAHQSQSEIEFLEEKPLSFETNQETEDKTEADTEIKYEITSELETETESQLESAEAV